MSCIITFVQLWSKHLRKQLREEKYISVHRATRFSSWCLGPVCLGRTSGGTGDVAEGAVYFMADRKEGVVL